MAEWIQIRLRNNNIEWFVDYGNTISGFIDRQKKAIKKAAPIKLGGF